MRPSFGTCLFFSAFASPRIAHAGFFLPFFFVFFLYFWEGPTFRNDSIIVSVDQNPRSGRKARDRIGPRHFWRWSPHDVITVITHVVHGRDLHDRQVDFPDPDCGLAA